MSNAVKGLPKVVAAINEDQMKVLDSLQTVSAKVRYLAAEGFSTPNNLYSGIANLLGIRTQHVRNVLTQLNKKG